MTNIDFFKLEEFADDDFEFDKNGGKFSKWVENTVFTCLQCKSFENTMENPHRVFKGLVLQTGKPARVAQW